MRRSSVLDSPLWSRHTYVDEDSDLPSVCFSSGGVTFLSEPTVDLFLLRRLPFRTLPALRRTTRSTRLLRRPIWPDEKAKQEEAERIKNMSARAQGKKENDGAGIIVNIALAGSFSSRFPSSTRTSPVSASSSGRSSTRRLTRASTSAKYSRRMTRYPTKRTQAACRWSSTGSMLQSQPPDPRPTAGCARAGAIREMNHYVGHVMERTSTLFVPCSRRLGAMVETKR